MNFQNNKLYLNWERQKMPVIFLLTMIFVFHMIPMELRCCCCKLIKHCDILELDAPIFCSVEKSIISCTFEEFNTWSYNIELAKFICHNKYIDTSWWTFLKCPICPMLPCLIIIMVDSPCHVVIHHWFVVNFFELLKLIKMESLGSLPPLLSCHINPPPPST